MRFSIAFTAVLVLVAAGCGGGGGGPSEEVTLNATEKQQAQDIATEPVDVMQNIEATPDSGLSGVFSIYSNAQLFQSKAQAGQMTGRAVVFPEPRDVSDCATYDAASGTATYDNCSYGGVYTMDGTITVKNGVLSVDLTMTGNAQGYTYDYTFKGTVTYSADQLTGQLEFKGTVNQSGMDIGWTTKVVYGVTLTSGCPTAGSIDITGSYNVSGYGGYGGGSQSVDARIDFGPACGDVTYFI